MALQTRKSDPNKPTRILVYGAEGCGKSTLGAKSDRPVFITPEGGTDQLTDAMGNPVEELPGIDSWDKLKSAVDSVALQDHEFKTLVLDSADWIEGLAHKKIIGTSTKTITTVNGGYGAGYRQSQNLHQDLIESLSTIREKRGMNIVITAHAHVKPVKDPEMTEDYDAFEIKCHELVSSLWREWVDGLFFVRFKTFVKSAGEDSKRARALSDGSRVLYTVKQPAFQAKNRYGMPPEMEFTENFWSEFMTYTRKGASLETTDEIRAEIFELSGKLDETTKAAICGTVEKSGNDLQKLIAIRTRVVEITKGAK